jgi:KDO2-lipid IV(A) lauroyltransferase
MGKIAFYLFYFANRIVTLLPLRVLYLFSYPIFFYLYYFPTYRRKIVSTNMHNAFPFKSKKEIKLLEKKFYRHLSDLFIETFKLTHMSPAQIKKRFTVENPELLEKLLSGKRDIIAVLGHYNNWEWLAALPFYTNYKFVCIYKPLKNKYFDNFINDLRTKFGTVITPMSDIIKEIINDRAQNINTISAFISDQTPTKNEIRYWTRFLNQDTPVYLGAEKVASKYGMAVVFFNLKKIKRGYYRLFIELLFDHTAGLPEHAITEAHVRRLEEIITENPEYWIWSHRRWKHIRNVEND